jgi:hypothetical protein
MSDRRLVLVVGVGRSGTSLMSGMLGQLGYHIPQPEVRADETNPRGFGEPRWVVKFHTQMLKRLLVTVNDARPEALEITGAVAHEARTQQRLHGWLETQFAAADALVVKDPRTVWFLPLWLSAAQELGAETSFVTMLRHPAEIVTSARKYYGTFQTPASRTGSWLNLILETERATRDAPRAFVRYESLLADWEPEIQRVGALIGSPELASIKREEHPSVDGFVDPALHRNRVGWEVLDVPPRLLDLADDVWTRIQALAVPGGDGPGARPALDAAREAYAGLYTEAESITQSSVRAARRKAIVAAEQAAAPAPPLRVRIARRIPKPYRRRLRRALGRLRARA